MLGNTVGGGRYNDEIDVRVITYGALPQTVSTIV